MSQPWQQPPSDNPYGQQPPQQQQPYGQPQQQPQPQAYGQQPQPPQQQPYAQQADGYPPGAYPPSAYGAPPVAPIPRRPARPGLGILAGVIAALVAIFVYAAILRFTDREIGYVALGVGLLVGAAMGKAGGRSPALPLLGALISLLAVWFGQLVGMAWMISHRDGALPFTDILFTHFSDLVTAWKTDFVDAKDILFFAFAGLEGFAITKRVGDNS